MPKNAVLLNTDPTHNLRASWVVRQVAKNGEAIVEASPPNKRSTPAPYDNVEILTVYEMFPSRNKRKCSPKDHEQVYHVAATSAWADIPITFGHTDQPAISSGHSPAALVLNPIIDGYRLHKVLWTVAVV